MSDAPFATRFRQARRRNKFTQAAVAKALVISQSAVAQWESGRSFPSPDLAAKIETLLGIQYHSTESGHRTQNRGPLGKRPRLPIVGLPAPGDEERILVDGNTHGEVLAPPQLENVAGAKALYVRGRSMEPRYYPGEVVYLDPTRPPNPGDFVFVALKEPGFPTAVGYIRQYVGEDLVHIRILTLNPKSEFLISRQDLVGIATVVGSGLF